MNRKEAKIFIIPMIIVILAALVISGCGGSTTAPVVGSRAPDFAASTLDGETITLDELRGQPVVLKFWATWCGYCRYQMPFFQAAFEERGHEVKFIGINLRESRDKVQQFVEGEGVGFTMALDVDGTVANSYNVRPIPATFFLDEQGIIKEIKIGAFMSQDELMAVLEELY